MYLFFQESLSCVHTHRFSFWLPLNKLLGFPGGGGLPLSTRFSVFSFSLSSLVLLPPGPHLYYFMPNRSHSALSPFFLLPPGPLIFSVPHFKRKKKILCQHAYSLSTLSPEHEEQSSEPFSSHKIDHFSVQVFLCCSLCDP